MFPKVVIVFLSPYRQRQKNFPFIVGKNGCFILLIAAIIDGECSAYSVAKSCLTLCNPMDWSLTGSSVHGIFQARVLDWIVISFSRGSSQPRDQTWVFHIVDRRFTIWATINSRRLNYLPHCQRTVHYHTKNFFAETSLEGQWLRLFPTQGAQVWSLVG